LAFYNNSFLFVFYFTGGKMRGYLVFLIAIISFSCTTTKTVTKVEADMTVREYKIDEYVGPKKKLAITKFENATRFGKRRLGDHISDVLATELGKTGRFILLDRENVDKILEQLSFSQAGLTEGELEQIQLIDADFLLTGTVTHYSVTTSGSKSIFKKSKTQTAEVAADVRMINVRTGEIILSESGRSIAERKYEEVLGVGESGGYDESLEMDAFRAAVIKLTENIIPAIDEIPWTCNVVKIAEAKLYIDAGKKSNLEIGDVMEIYHKGAEVKNLAGQILGYEETRVGSGTVVDFIGEDGAILQVESGEEFTMPLICKISPENIQQPGGVQ
jgi:curli biogenesis system outer membrane secretion channel CsgG